MILGKFSQGMNSVWTKYSACMLACCRNFTSHLTCRSLTDAVSCFFVFSTWQMKRYYSTCNHICTGVLCFLSTNSWSYLRRVRQRRWGCQVQMDQKCKIAHQNMPNTFKKPQQADSCQFWLTWMNNGKNTMLLRNQAYRPVLACRIIKYKVTNCW